MKKYIVLIVLFVLPLVAYLFFSSGINSFGRLPVLNEDLSVLRSYETDSITFDDKITILTFFGHNFDVRKVHAFNMKEKIYDRYHEFDNFQVVSVTSINSEEDIKTFKAEINKSSDASEWLFMPLEDEDMRSLFNSLNSDLQLDNQLSTPYAFIIDKKMKLRGRSDDEEEGTKFAYDMSNLKEVSDKMNDDVKIILAEYRFALKKNNAQRQK
jgi:alkyl hydroperoxide reductase subunit AhpC